MVVQSHEVPIRYLEENGKVKVRLNVRQEIKEDTVSYVYDEYVYETSLDIALGMSLKLIKQEYTEYTYANLVEYYKASNVSDYTLLVQEYIDSQELIKKTNEANAYLKDTDWVDSYKIRHDLGLELIPEDSSKWEILSKREGYKLFLKGDE
jgi:hypothetical protein